MKVVVVTILEYEMETLVVDTNVAAVDDLFLLEILVFDAPKTCCVAC